VPKSNGGAKGVGGLDPSVHLERISKLLALLAIKDMKQIEQVAYLNAAGFPSSEIASILQTTQNTIDVTLSRLRSDKKKKNR
jgi:DNA-directed RNA polymerase specialized sigma24 family protein